VVVEQRFLELDRATLTIARLIDELSRYARLYKATGAESEPIWNGRYPWFPPILCVLAGNERPALERRRETAVAMLSRDRDLPRTLELSIRLCLAADLAEAGPFEPIFANTKFIRGATRFQRRGLAACRAEWKLLAATHNVLKLWRAGLARPAPA
jgi:hypothetical protein